MESLKWGIHRRCSSVLSFCEVLRKAIKPAYIKNQAVAQAARREMLDTYLTGVGGIELEIRGIQLRLTRKDLDQAAMEKYAAKLLDQARRLSDTTTEYIREFGTEITHNASDDVVALLHTEDTSTLIHHLLSNQAQLVQPIDPRTEP